MKRELFIRVLDKDAIRVLKEAAQTAMLNNDYIYITYKNGDEVCIDSSWLFWGEKISWAINKISHIDTWFTSTEYAMAELYVNPGLSKKQIVELVNDREGCGFDNVEYSYNFQKICGLNSVKNFKSEFDHNLPLLFDFSEDGTLFENVAPATQTQISEDIDQAYNDYMELRKDKEFKEFREDVLAVADELAYQRANRDYYFDFQTAYEGFLNGAACALEYFWKYGEIMKPQPELYNIHEQNGIIWFNKYINNI